MNNETNTQDPNGKSAKGASESRWQKDIKKQEAERERKAKLRVKPHEVLGRELMKTVVIPGPRGPNKVTKLEVTLRQFEKLVLQGHSKAQKLFLQYLERAMAELPRRPEVKKPNPHTQWTPCVWPSTAWAKRRNGTWRSSRSRWRS